jgi:hypothetical protein
MKWWPGFKVCFQMGQLVPLHAGTPYVDTQAGVDKRLGQIMVGLYEVESIALKRTVSTLKTEM